MGEVCRTRKIVRRTWCLIKLHLLRLEVRCTKRIVRRTLALFINSSLDSLLDPSHNDLFIHNHKDHLGKFDAKADDGYFLGYSFILKAFRVFNTRRQQVEETYHVTFDESMEAIRFTNTLVDEIGIDYSFRYPPDEFLQEDDPSIQYQVDSDVSYYIIPHRHSFTELTQENHVLEVIAPNEPEIPHTEDSEGPPDLINTEGTHEQNV
ncbi:retrovirus-related pol polyprotein from transposon TNT 1-94 [Tanacetum coccineum]